MGAFNPNLSTSNLLRRGGTDAMMAIGRQVAKTADPAAPFSHRVGPDFGPSNGAEPSDNGVPPSDNGYEPGAMPMDEEGGSPIALWIGLGAIILGGGGFIAYKLIKGRKAPPAPPELP
jgi:hypothetical protein